MFDFAGICKRRSAGELNKRAAERGRHVCLRNEAASWACVLGGSILPVIRGEEAADVAEVRSNVV